MAGSMVDDRHQVSFYYYAKDLSWLMFRIMSHYIGNADSWSNKLILLPFPQELWDYGHKLTFPLIILSISDILTYNL